ncbi:hypothetical protein DK389_06670 [Methylobacterium durans]|uniref:Uncharacterized protein n=1 Tax=Methylobacterium durans TaxID=2202825 RepID=A0A2U8W2H4_9HYPH|nr:hypothetical protein DK389_06670 [Methylobacterium durans]
MTFAPVRTVSDWRASGYRGLRILRCSECGSGTHQTWGELEAEPNEDVVAVARRVRCHGCEQPPAGLAVATYRDADERS